MWVPVIIGGILYLLFAEGDKKPEPEKESGPSEDEILKLKQERNQINRKLKKLMQKSSVTKGS
jgi:hypothetical protein